MEGRLKHKLLGDDGVLYWKSRAFVLRSGAHALEITDARSSGYGVPSLPAASSGGRDGDRNYFCGGPCVTHVSLEGARCAEAWSGINAFNGCGFDLVWAGGRTWSLLCDDPLSRKSWVDAINSSIASVLNETGTFGPTSQAAFADRRQRPDDFPPASMRTAQNSSSHCGSHPSAGVGAPAFSTPQAGPPKRCDDHYSRYGRETSLPELEAECSGRGGRVAADRSSSRGRRRGPSAASSYDSGRISPRDLSLIGVASVPSTGGGRQHHQQQQYRPQGKAGRRRQRQEGTAPNAGHLDRRCSDASNPGTTTFMSPVIDSSTRVSGERERGSRADSASSIDDKASPNGRQGGGGGGGGSRSASTRDRSEELARASAATWGQFQELLERSRASKARFDRAMGEASASSASSGGGSAAAASGLPSPPRRRARARIGTPKIARGATGVVKRGAAVEPPPAHSQVVGSRCAHEAEASDSRSEAPASENRSMVGSLGGCSSSCTDRVSDVSTPRSRGPGGTVKGTSGSGEKRRGRSGGSEREEGGGKAATVVPGRISGQECLPARCDSATRLCDDGSWETNSGSEMDVAALTRSGVGAEATTDLERSRLSAGVTDVETSLLPDDGSPDASEGEEEDGSGRSVAGSGSTAGDSGDASWKLEGGEGGDRRKNQQQERPRRSRVSSRWPCSSRSSSPVPSASKPPAPPPRHLRATKTSVARAAAREAEDGVATTTTAGHAKNQQVGADGDTTGREVGAQTEISEENQRLREELAALKGAVAAERQKEREREAEASGALVGRERDEAAAAAAAKELAQAAAAHRVSKARLKEALADAEEAERGRLEAVRQREELEKALAAEIRERRRVSELLEACSRSETALRKRADATVTEGDLKAKLASARSELEAVSLERNALAEELDQCISRLGDQAREVASALRSRQQREIAEISSRCEIEKEALRERLVLEAEEKAREDGRVALSDQERRIRGEMATQAAQDAKRREKQLREAKAEAKAAGEATRKDIERLRGLHARRVKRLEALLKEEGDNLADARREIAACKATLAGDAGEFQRWTEEQRDQSSRLLKELAVIQNKVDRAVKMEAEAREREGLAMSRLRKVMEEARLERAESAEVKRQLREALAELEADRNTQVRRARTNLQLQRAAEIARQEVAMVEAERKRWYEERRSMEGALERLKRLVYGTGNANTTNDHHLCSDSAAGKNTAVCPWKPPGGKVVVGGRGHGTGARAPCSPIGVNAFRQGNARGIGSNTRGAVYGGGQRGRR